MGTLFRHSRHIVRMVGMFGVGLLAFIVLRAIFIPKGFGELGHYRRGALDEVASRTPVHAGRKACVDCHTDVAEKQKGSLHESVSCENCHGPQGAHAAAADPSASKPKLPDGEKLCAGCHEKSISKPRKFKQVDTKGHSGGAACKSCHAAHAPAPQVPASAPAPGKASPPVAAKAAPPAPAPKSPAKETKS
ncbi:MAG: hypothetical protein HY823_09240 [Acidobacteria bacterium]|nr:hypothetical protein [Acidobacteriota bacterium]